MNSKEKEVQMHPVIRNPEAISDDEIPDPEAQVPQMQQGAGTSSTDAARSTTDTPSSSKIQNNTGQSSNTIIHNGISNTYMCRV